MISITTFVRLMDLFYAGATYLSTTPEVTGDLKGSLTS